MSIITMKCASCGKPLGKPAALIGKLALGPICARRAGLTLRATQRAIRRANQHRPPARNPDQMALFAEALT